MDQTQFNLDVAHQKYKVWYIKEVALAEQALSQFMEKDVLFGFDLETMSYPEYRFDTTAPLDPLRSTPRLVQICDGRNTLVFDLLYIPRELITPFLESKKLIAHNAMFELRHCYHNFGCKNVDIGCTYLATKLLHHAIYPDDGGISAGLEDIAQSLLKLNLFKNISHKHWFQPDLNFEQVQYAALDAIVVLKVAEKLVTGLKKYGLTDVYQLYKEAQHPLVMMELNGMKIDAVKHREMIGVWKLEAYAAKKELLKLTGLDDITSHKIADYLDKNLPLNIRSIWPLTESGKLSTDANTFSEFSWVDVVEPFARFQKASTLSSTFGMKLQHKISPVSGRIHTSYKLCGARTGRLSSSNPNLQNMPRDAQFRSLFVPEEGNVFVVADFNQIELRVCAELSQDEQMLNAYRLGMDLHSLTAANTARKPVDQLTKEDRQRAKALNFGLVFGLGADGFQKYAKKQYKVELDAGQAYFAVREWHDLYAGYTEWQHKQAADCSLSLHVRTPLGKLRKLSWENHYGASANTPVQGGASECILRSLCGLNSGDLPTSARLINTVHDEIIVECPDDKDTINHVVHALERHMHKGFLSVFPNGITRNLVQISHGANWADAK